MNQLLEYKTYNGISDFSLTMLGVGTPPIQIVYSKSNVLREEQDFLNFVF